MDRDLRSKIHKTAESETVSTHTGPLDKALAMADWRSAMENNMAKQQVEFTTMAVELTVVSSAKQPFGLGFPGKINARALDSVKKLKSPADGFTYMLKWLKKKNNAGGFWAHLFSKSHAGFCTLEDVLASQGFIELWNSVDLISVVSFKKDTLDGETISEEEAIRLNKSFDPDAGGHESSNTEAGPSDAPPPATVQRRRTFAQASSSTDASSTGKRARRPCAQSRPAARLAYGLIHAHRHIHGHLQHNPVLFVHRKRRRDAIHVKYRLFFYAPFIWGQNLQPPNWQYSHGTPLGRVWCKKVQDLRHLMWHVHELIARCPYVDWGTPGNRLCASDLWPYY